MYYEHEFEGEVGIYDYGRMVYTVVYLPASLVPDLPFAKHPRLRITGEVADLAFDGAWIPDGKGRWYIIVNKNMMKEAGLRVGDPIDVRFNVADQDAVDVPFELAAALGDDEAARDAWDKLTPGKQRGLCYRVASAKTAPTKDKRVAEVLAALG